jgi:orotidine-5'-phosphate decarboxylase
MTFIDKLRAAQAQQNSWLCVGLDPTPDLIPPDVALLDFGRQIIDATAEYVCAYKFNLSFFLAYGVEGLHALLAYMQYIPDDIPIILDAKFGDITYTAQHYARTAFEQFQADAVTVTPYIGLDAVTPLMAYPEHFVFVLVRSANTTGSDFQCWPSARAPLYRYVTAQVNTLARQYPAQLGLMVSATKPGDLANIRSWAPTIPFLIPGLGVQQGDLHVAVEHGPTRTGIGPLISVARAIINASQGADFADAARQSAAAWREKIQTVKRLYHD